MMPCHFGRADSPLFGIYHEPLGPPRNSAVLMCYPVAHEYMTAHPSFRDLAHALAREGVGVLRFDYWGTGDSYGEQLDTSLDKWEASVDLAAEELQDMLGAAQINLVGLRLGAVLAARYARRARVKNLVLWDPVVSGHDYLAGLRALHNARLANRRGTPVTAAPATETSVEIAGFLYPYPLREALEAIDLCAAYGAETAGSHTPRRTVVIGAQDLPAYRRLAGCLPGKVARHVVADAAPWDVPGRWGDPLRARTIPGRIVEELKRARA